MFKSRQLSVNIGLIKNPALFLSLIWFLFLILPPLVIHNLEHFPIVTYWLINYSVGLNVQILPIFFVLAAIFAFLTGWLCAQAIFPVKLMRFPVIHAYMISRIHFFSLLIIIPILVWIFFSAHSVGGLANLLTLPLEDRHYAGNILRANAFPGVRTLQAMLVSVSLLNFAILIAPDKAYMNKNLKIAKLVSFSLFAIGISITILMPFYVSQRILVLLALLAMLYLATFRISGRTANYIIVSLTLAFFSLWILTETVTFNISISESVRYGTEKALFYLVNNFQNNANAIAILLNNYGLLYPGAFLAEAADTYKWELVNIELSRVRGGGTLGLFGGYFYYLGLFSIVIFLLLGFVLRYIFSRCAVNISSLLLFSLIFASLANSVQTVPLVGIIIWANICFLMICTTNLPQKLLRMKS